MASSLSRRWPALLLASGLVVAVASGCATGDDARSDSQAGVTSLSFSEALSEGDGAAACELLAENTRSTLEKDAESSCDEAVISLGLPTATALDTVQAFGRGAQSVMDTDLYFLVLEEEGWRVTAAGCEARAPLPYDCELKGE